MEDILNNIYDNMIAIILRDIPDDNKIIVEQSYMEYLKNQYFEKYKNFKDLNKLQNFILDFETKKWEDMHGPMKQSFLLKDESLDKIILITSIGFEAAKKRKETGELLDVSLVDDYKNEINELYKTVKDFNKFLADWHISEGVTDLEYACGRTENTSLRMGH